MYMFQGSSLSGATSFGNTKGLVGAIQREKVEDVWRILEENSFSIDDLSRGLHAAASVGNSEIVSLVLKHPDMPPGGADIHDSTGLTPLIIAAKKGHHDVVKALIKVGCKLDKSTFKIRATALHWAASQGYTECVKLLVEGGANIESLTSNYRTPVMMGARAGHPDIVCILVDAGCNVNCSDFEGATPLHLAAEEGNDMCARILLRAGSDINKANKHGFTPLLSAARKGHDETVGLLLRRCGFELEIEKKCRQMSALHWAAEGGNPACVSRLLQHGADPNEATLKAHIDSQYVVIAGTTPLMLAARRSHHEVCRTLLQYGADPNLVDKEGMTALLYAAKLNLPLVAETLIEGGAAPNGVGPEFHTTHDPLEGANVEDVGSIQETEVSSRMGGAGRSVDDVLLDSVVAASVFDMALHDELDLDDLEELEEVENPMTSPLFMAIDRENIEVLKVLLRCNADLNVVAMSTLGPMTPLELALLHGNIPVCKMLIAAGFNASFYIANAPVMQETMATLATENPEFFELMVTFLQSPPRLSHLARNAARKCLGTHAHKTHKKLPVPEIMQRFINMSEFDDTTY